MSKGVTPAVEFSRLISADQIGVQETVREIAANAAERAALAERFGLLSLDRLTASLGLVRRRSGLIQLRGRFEADLVQACVVSLEPVPAHLTAEFTVPFGAAPEDGAGDGGEVVVSVEGEDPPEEIVDGRIDLGEAVAQQLAVAIDPYPRSPAAQAAESADGTEGEAGRKPNPFAALSAWRRPEDD